MQTATDNQQTDVPELSQTYRFVLSRLEQASIPMILEVLDDARVLLRKRQEQLAREAAAGRVMQPSSSARPAP